MHAVRKTRFSAWALVGGKMNAIDFCRRWFGVDHLPPNELRAYEKERRRWTQYGRLLASATGASFQTVKQWGHEFERMPAHYKPTLFYLDVLRSDIEQRKRAYFQRNYP